jgi:restriction system protein
MAVPDFQTLMLPLLHHAAKAGGETHIAALIDEIAKEFALTDDDKATLIPSGGQADGTVARAWRHFYNLARTGSGLKILVSTFSAGSHG